jgi:nitrous oxidase accessory protein
MMRTKSITIRIAFFVTLLCIATKTYSRTIVVPEDFNSIQKAIDTAKLGETVFVKKGIYDETIKIKKSITLTGEDANLVTITGRNADGTVRIENNSKVVIANLTFEYFKDKYNTCIEIRGGELTLKDCIIRGFTGCGINMHSGAKGTVENCLVEECKQAGIYAFQNTTYAVVRNNVCLDNGSEGIFFNDSASGEVFGNICHGNKSYGIIATGA